MKAKRYIYAIITILALTGCIQEKFIEDGAVEEGVPVTIRLNFGVDDGVSIMTRGLQTELDESRVNSLRVIVFNSAGKTVTNQVFPTSKITYTSGKTEGYVEVPTVTGSGMKIFGVANELTNSDFTTSVNAISNLDDLMALPVIANDANVSISRGANFLMSGWFNDGSKSVLAASDVTITANESQDYKYIYLSRLDAKVEFKFTVGSDIDKFTPLSYAVYNVPKQAYLCGYLTDGSERALGAGYPYDANCFNTTPVNFDNATDDNAFGFYILESNLASKNNATTFAHRDLKDKGTIAEGTNSGAYDYNGGDWNGQWAYANTYSPYVQIRGRIEYGEQSSGFISANVTYNIHLGDFSEGDYNDFSTRRNTHYTYNITVNGANDIVVEVENNNERMPSVEGTVVVADGKIITVDSHYSSRVLTFESGTINAEEAAVLSWFISTPYSVGTPNETATKESLDYQWVEFYPQTKNTGVTASYTDYVAWYNSSAGNNGSRYYVEDLVNDLKVWYSKKSESKWPDAEAIYVTAFVNEFYYDYGTGDRPTGGSGAEAELTAMWKKVVNADDRYMHILCKVNTSKDGSSTVMGSAYSIFQHSIQTIYNTDPAITDLKVAWGTEMINDEKTDEIMALYGTSSYDGRLWGHILSDSQTTGTLNDNRTTKFNGRYNTSLIWKEEDLAWTGKTNSKLKESYIGPVLASVQADDATNPLVYACLTRNRDNDGSGKIETEEIRWYIAAIDQYFGLFIGEQGINKDASLYPTNIYECPKYHYLSSTAGGYGYSNHTNASGVYKNGRLWNEGFVFWAEEAGSTSPGDVNWNKQQNRFNVRCLRNLGKDTPDNGMLGSSVQNYSSFQTKTITNKDNSTSTIGVITSTFINTSSLRAKVFAEGEQYGVGDETYANNRPHVEFFIAPTNSATTTYSALKENIENGNLDSVCPEGWRVPYGKELSLMFALIPSDSDASSYNGEFIDWSNPNNTSTGGDIGHQWLSSTYSRFGAFGDQTWSSSRYAICATGNGITTVSDNSARYVRCVKDNTAYAPQTPVTTLNDGGNAF